MLVSAEVVVGVVGPAKLDYCKRIREGVHLWWSRPIAGLFRPHWAGHLNWGRSGRVRPLKGQPRGRLPDSFLKLLSFIQGFICHLGIIDEVEQHP